MGRFPKLGTLFNRDFRNSYNQGVDKIDAELDAQINRVDNLIANAPQPSEVVDARGGEAVLGNRLNNFDTQLAQTSQQVGVISTNKADKTEVDSLQSLKADKLYVDNQIGNIGNASPKGTYPTLSALQSAFPNGTTGIYIVTADGKWYYWNDLSWTAGEAYQSTGIAGKSVSLSYLSDKVVYDNYNVLSGLEWEMGSIDSQYGTNSSFTTRIRTKGYLPAGKYILRITDPAIKFNLFFYTLDGFIFKSTSGFSDDMEYEITDAFRVRAVLAYDDNRNLPDTSISGKADILQSKVTKLEKDLSLIDYKTKKISSGDEIEFNVSVNSESDLTIVNDELWTFYPSNDQHTDYQLIRRYNIDFINKTAAWLGEFQHNFGHANTVDYCKETDTLITGNGSGDYNLAGKIFIIPNAYAIKDLTQADINSLAVIIDISSYNLGSKPNVVWGESNNGNYNICYLITNDQKDIRKLLLGRGSNNLGKGQFIAGKAVNEFNGTFKIISHYKQDTAGYDDVIQGGDYYNGTLYTGAGHDGIRYWQNKFLTDGTIERIDKIERIYGDDGNEVFTTMNGLTIYNGHLLVKSNKGLRAIKL